MTAFLSRDGISRSNRLLEKSPSRRRVPEWELLVHTRQFSYEWQIQGLQDTENERVRKREIEKGLRGHTLQHKVKIVYPSTALGTTERPAPAGRPATAGRQRKDLEESCERKWARSGNRPGWLASSSCKSLARSWLTVNKYYKLDIIRMEREGVEKAAV